MFLRGSRYEKTLPFRAEAGPAPAFRGIQPRRIGAATGALEHTVREGERLDLLALHYYNDARLWWRIADANAQFVNGADLLLNAMVGRVILIPKGRE